jgi:hypothetical protein
LVEGKFFKPRNIAARAPQGAVLDPLLLSLYNLGMDRTRNINSNSSSVAVLTPWSCALLENPPVMQLLKNFPAFYGIQRFITVFTRALHWSLS